MKKETETDTKTQAEGTKEANAPEENAAEVANANKTDKSKKVTTEELNAQLSAALEELNEENNKLKKTVTRLQSSADKSDLYLTQLVAMKNDFESYKRRMKLNTEQAKAEGVQSVAVKLIDIADTFEIAQTHISDAETLKAFDMIYRKLQETLSDCGIKAMDVKGKAFDHNTMEALSTMDFGEQNRGKVVEIYKNGYTMGEKIVRYAQVIVGA